MKKLAIYAGIGYGLYYFFTKGKAAVAAYNSLKTKVVSARNLKPGISQFSLEIDVLVTNTGTAPIDINTNGLVTLKRVNLYSTKGTLIGYSTPGATSLNIPAGGSQRINNIPTVINTAYVVEALGDLNNVKNVNTTIELEAAGQIITV
ncbi:MAG: hypothetical protein Q8O62_09865 [Aequorivita sp.]|nr:hypothetical protein [Aequorivita sp.]